MEVRVYALHILAFQNGVHHIPRNLGRGHAPYDFLIFLKDFRRYTERVTAVKEASPHRISDTAKYSALNNPIVSHTFCIASGGLVFYQVKTLIAVESKLLVAGKERKTLGDGMGNDDVVAGVAVVLLLVEPQVGVCEGRVAT